MIKPGINHQTSEIQDSTPRNQNWFLTINYLAIIGIAEFILYFVSVPAGVALQFVILIALILHSALDRYKMRQDLWLALGLVPLIRIVSIAISPKEVSSIIWYILIGVPVFIVSYSMTRYLKYSLNEIGLNSRYPIWQIFIGMTGISLGMIDYLILKPAPLVERDLVKLIFSGLVLLICSGFIEELAFRGIIQRAASVLGSWGWVTVAPLYALMQIGHGSFMHIMFTLGVSLFFGFVVLRTRSIFGVSMAHGILNIMLFLVMPNIV